MKKYAVHRSDLLFPELSFSINGVLFDVHNQLGGGRSEKYYQKAVAVALKDRGVSFQEQYYAPVKFHGTVIGKQYLDFLIENKIVLELKRGRYIPATIIHQTKQYLVALDLQLAIIGCFAHDCVVPKRIINQYGADRS